MSEKVLTHFIGEQSHASKRHGLFYGSDVYMLMVIPVQVMYT